MSPALRFYSSSTGKKAVMGITGLIGIGFVIGHMAGNLLVLQGQEEMNSYAHFLRSTGELLWIVRGVLVVAVVLHVIAAVQLTVQNRAARPAGYARREPQVSTLASRTMRWGGGLLLAFIVLHILHFTTGTLRPAGSFDRVDVYSNVVSGFRIWWVSLFYLASMIALGFHLYHGAWSSVRSLGASRPSRNPLSRRVALTVAVVVWLGFSMVPLAVFGGWTR